MALSHSKQRPVAGAGLMLSVFLCASPVVSRAAQPGDAPGAHADRAPCFIRREWTGGWKATRDARTIYIPVAGSIYRLDLQASYSVLRDPFAILTNRDSTDSICGPLDFRLEVSNQAGIRQWPIVKRMTRLTPEQAARLPKRLRP